MNALQTAANNLEREARSAFRNMQKQDYRIETTVGNDVIAVKLTKRITLHAMGVNVNFYLNGKRTAFAKLA